MFFKLEFGGLAGLFFIERSKMKDFILRFILICWTMILTCMTL
jgi:hypothetical protein